MNENNKKLAVGITIRSLVALAISFVCYYFMLPPINLRSKAFWGFSLLVIAIFVLCLSLKLGKLVRAVAGDKSVTAWKHAVEPARAYGKRFYLTVAIISAIPLLVLGIGVLSSSTVFNAKKYASVITVSERDFVTDMPTTDRVTNIALMDTDSARILGNRKLGALSGVVSQYVASEKYTQINYQGKPMKIANLEYDGFFKWLGNSDKGIPGYVMVDPVANSAEYYEMEKGMIYAESGYFSHDLMRKLRFSYPSKIFQNVSFEIDETGKVYYVVSCAAPKVGLFGAMDINEAIIFDPVTGESTLYALADIPAWVDIVFDGYLACEKYDWQGTLSGGFINSIIGNKGCKQTTDDFGYIVLGDDVWYFTGVTSVTSDASNIGFILSCARTGEYKFYSVIGAEEHSAMGAAEGEVQEKEYVASFPSLVNIGGEPSYIMVLKDANGLVKLYALVNVRQYNIVATGETQSAAIENYINLLAQNGLQTPPAEEPELTGETKTVIVDRVEFLSLSGVTYAYIIDTLGNVYRIPFDAANEGVIFVKNGTQMTVTYQKNESTGICEVQSWALVD